MRLMGYALAFIAGLALGGLAVAYATAFLRQRRIQLGIERAVDRAGA